MALASLLAQTFQLPQTAPADTRAVSPAEQMGPAMGAPQTGLQQVDEATRGYYQKWGELQDFATNLWTNFGIDVTKPDFRSPEAMEAHEVYRKALADLRYQGDALKTGQEMLKMGYAAALRDPNVQAAEGFDPSRDIAGAESYVQTGMTDQEKIKAQFDLAKLRLDDKKVSKLTGYEGLVSQIAGVLQGGGEWTPSQTVSDEGGLLLQNNMLTGKKFGKVNVPTERGGTKVVDKIVSGFFLNPETGEMTISFENAPDEVIGKDDMPRILSTYIESNPGDGFTTKGLEEFFEAVDVTAPRDPASYPVEGIEDLNKKARKLYDDSKPQVAEQRAAYDKQLSDITRIWGTGKIELPTGHVLKVDRGTFLTGGKYLIDNWDELGTGVENPGRMTKEELLDLLASWGVYGSKAAEAAAEAINQGKDPEAAAANSASEEAGTEVVVEPSTGTKEIKDF